MAEEKKKRISEITKNEVEIYSKSVKVFDGFDFDWHKVIRRIRLYRRGLYTTKQEDGTKFWKLGNKREPHFRKHIDFDTKHFMPYGTGDTSFVQAWIVKQEFLNWAKETKLPQDLNNLSTGLTVCGLHVWKKVPVKDDDKKNEVQDCRLDRLYFDVTAEKNIDQKPKIEQHFLTKDQIIEKTESWGGKDNIKKALENAERTSDGFGDDDDGKKAYLGVDSLDQYIFWEREGYFEVDGEQKYMHYIFCGYGDKEVIVLDEELKKSNFYFFNLGDNDGLLPSVAVYERLFDIQEEVNDLVNYNSKNNAIASLLLLKTKNSSFKGLNGLTDLETGTILDDPSLDVLNISNRYLSDFIAQLREFESEADKLCMTPNIVRGENLPSSATFRGLAVQANAAKDAFKNTRDGIASKVIGILTEDILPSLVAGWNKEHLLEIMENNDDIRIYDENRINFGITQKHAEFKADNPESEPTMEIITDWVREIKQEIEQKGRKVSVPKGYFNFKYGIRIEATNESSEKEQKNNAYFNVISWIQQDPTVADNPYFRQYVELNGITPIRMKHNSPLDLDKPPQQQTGGKALVQPKQPDSLMSMVDEA